MDGAISVFNAGSSSLRFTVFVANTAGGGLLPLRRGKAEGIGHRRRFQVAGADGAPVAGEETEDRAREFDHVAALERILAWIGADRALPALAAAGHRVVHGGTRSEAALLTPGLLEELERLVPLAPLHQPHNLRIVRALAAARPGLPQVACFDTAFHRSQPALARLLPLPEGLRARGIERYGFHGISYASIAARLPALLGDLPRARVIAAHLGNGASLCALRDGESVATTMGFSTLDGLLMGTRCGALDPGVALHLILREGMPPAEVEDLLYHRCGLLGLSGASHDMRELLASPDPRAAEAVAAFVYRLGREIGSLAAALGGLDALVFTAGIGENATAVRERACAACAWLGLELDPAANAAHGPRISAAGSRVSAWVVPADEEGQIARDTLRVADGRR